MSERIKNRIRSRLFNGRDISEGPAPCDRSSLNHPSASADMFNTKSAHRIRDFLEKIPVAGYVIIWCWRLISLPPRFHRLSRHFESHVEDVEAMKSALTGQSDHIEHMNQALKSAQRGYDDAFERITSSLKTIQETSETNIRKLHDTLQKMKETRENDLQDLQKTIQELRIRHDKSSSNIDSITDQLRELHERLERMREPVSLPDTLTAHIPAYLSPEEKKSGDQDIFYYTFERIFRGSEGEIEKRQRVYLEYAMESSQLVSEGLYFLDAGCGRGEFLRILREAGVPARGVELNATEYSILKSKGFDVELADINSFLESTDNDSLSGISCFQVIEHFSPDYLRNFLDHAHRKIAPHGILILETVNTKCNVALSNFFLDPSHVTPYPPELLKFLLEWHGFQETKIIYFHPMF
jgi:O-antigen chain-terminating methyltransferase